MKENYEEEIFELWLGTRAGRQPMAGVFWAKTCKELKGEYFYDKL